MNALVLQNPQITIQGDTLTTTTWDVAEFFDRKHYRVLRALGNLECSADFTSRHFWRVVKTIETHNGGTKEVEVFEMTQDGFTFLAMGFTGQKAAEFKEAYINRFRAMETELLQKYKQAALKTENPTITPAEQLALRKAMEKYVCGLNEHYSRSTLFNRSWHDFHVAFAISKLDQMPSARFDEGLRFIDGTWAPQQIEIEATKVAQASIPDDMIMVKKDALLGLVNAAKLADERYQEIYLLEEAMNIADQAVVEATRALASFRARTGDAINMVAVLSTSCKRRIH